MAKKKSKSSDDKELVLSFEATKITLDNVKEFFESCAIFIVIDSDGKIVNQFSNRGIFVANTKHVFSHIFDGNVVSKSIKIHTSELQEDYNNAMSDMKVLIKEYIKKGVLYGKLL